jgi:AmmeMemoRadiSam system protein B
MTWALVSCHETKSLEGPAMKKEDTQQVVRQPAVAGQFYPGRESALRREVVDYLNSVSPKKIDGRILGLISPHAGYTYSGRAAAYGYSLLKGKGFKRAVILAPSHRAAFRGAALSDADSFKTPLGLVPLDKKACSELLSHELYANLPRAHEYEHSLEVQLPFLQEVLGDFTLVPIVIGQLRDGDAATIASPLKKLLGEKTIIIASSDFTHYGAAFDYLPFTDNVKENLKRLDLGAVEIIQKMDASGFDAYVERKGATICGRYPIQILLETLPKDARGHLLKYETSGYMTGDYSHCVSYVSMVFTVPR